MEYFKTDDYLIALASRCGVIYVRTKTILQSGETRDGVVTGCYMYDFVSGLKT